MSGFQKIWLVVCGFAFGSGVLVSDTLLVEIGLSGFIGFLVGWKGDEV